MSWDDDDFEPPILAKLANQSVPTHKDEEEEPEEPKKETPAPVVTPTPAAAPKPKATKKATKASAKTEESKDERLSDPAAEKQRLEKLQIESDMQNAKDLFGVDPKDNEKIVEIDVLDAMKPVTEADFEDFAKVLASKALKHERNPHFIKFFKALVRNLSNSTEVSSEDMKEITKTINIIVNQKIEAEKGKKKKTTSKKASLNIREDIKDDYELFS